MTVHSWHVVGAALAFLGAVLTAWDVWRALAWQRTILATITRAVMRLRAAGKEPLHLQMPPSTPGFATGRAGTVTIRAADAQVERSEYEALQRSVGAIDNQLREMRRDWSETQATLQRELAVVRRPSWLTLVGALLAVGGLAVLVFA